MEKLIILLIAHRLLALVTGSIEGYLDQRKRSKGKIVKHGKSLFWRFIAAVPVVSFITYIFVLQIGRFDWVQVPFYFALCLLADALMYGIGLNITFNVRDNRELTSLGTNADLDKKQDQTWLAMYLLISAAILGLEYSLYLANS